jgi:hypothetical protein
MEKLPFTKETSTIALVFFIVYAFYGFMYIPYIQYLTSLAVGAIAYGITESYEIGIISLLLMNMLYKMLGGPVTVVQEGFMASKPDNRSGLQPLATSPTEVSARIQSIQKGTYGKELAGVGSPMTEGFASFSEGFEDTPAPATVPEDKKDPVPTTISAQGVPPANQPATAIGGTAGAGTTTTATPATSTSGASTNSAGVTTAGVTAAASTTTTGTGTGTTTTTGTSGFQDNGSLFKLGQIPTDDKGGFHIDAGTTVVNALQALKPDQIKSMTADTKQLIETQKSLMSMLQTFQPMMMEGKAMMDTFNQMFTPTAGATSK